MPDTTLSRMPCSMAVFRPPITGTAVGLASNIAAWHLGSVRNENEYGFNFTLAGVGAGGKSEAFRAHLLTGPGPALLDTLAGKTVLMKRCYGKVVVLSVRRTLVLCLLVSLSAGCKAQSPPSTASNSGLARPHYSAEPENRSPGALAV